MQECSFEQKTSHNACLSHAPQPDYPQISQLVSLHEREIFGTPEHAVFDAVPASRQSRLDGMLAILGTFDGYQEFVEMPHEKFQKLKLKLNDKKRVNGESITVGEILGGGHSTLQEIYEAKVIENDPLVQVLYEIKHHEPALKESAYEELMDDALVVFAKDALQEILTKQLKECHMRQ